MPTINVTRFRVHFAGSNGKRRYIGATEGSRTHYPMQADAAELFDTFEAAGDAADAVPARYMVRCTVPVIQAVRRLASAPIPSPHGSLADAMRQPA